MARPGSLRRFPRRRLSPPRLPPDHTDLEKRLAQPPKLYWRDGGRAHALLGFESESVLLGQPWVGASFECHVIEQILTHLEAMGYRAEPYYLRTHDGHELISSSRRATRAGVRGQAHVAAEPPRWPGSGSLADAIGAERRTCYRDRMRWWNPESVVVCDLPWLLGTWVACSATESRSPYERFECPIETDRVSVQVDGLVGRRLEEIDVLRVARSEHQTALAWFRERGISAGGWAPPARRAGVPRAPRSCRCAGSARGAFAEGDPWAPTSSAIQRCRARSGKTLRDERRYTLRRSGLQPGRPGNLDRAGIGALAVSMSVGRETRRSPELWSQSVSCSRSFMRHKRLVSCSPLPTTSSTPPLPA